MVFETGLLQDVRIAEESNYGVPVAPGASVLPAISCNFTNDENLIEDRTVYSEDPDLRSEKAGHFQPTFELVLGIPVFSSGTPAAAADNDFVTLMEFALGKAAVQATTGVLPTYNTGDAFFDLSGDAAIVMEMGNVSNNDSFTIYKKTITGHETAYGCIIQNVTIRGGLDEFVLVTITGQCKGVSKFMDGVALDAALEMTNQNFTVADAVKGRIGVGSFIKFVDGSGFLPATGGRLVAEFDPDTLVGTYAGTNLGVSMAADSAIVDALVDGTYTNYQEESIFGDGSLVSVDGGVNLVGPTSWEVSINTGAMAYNRSVADLSPVGTYQQDRRITLTVETDVDSENSQIDKAAEQSSVKDIQIVAGGLSAAAGGLVLFRLQNTKLRRSHPQSPREGLSSVRYTATARAKGFGSSKQSPLAMYIR